MKKFIIILALGVTSFINAQVYKGKGDFKAQVGAGLQSKANAIFLSGDYGVGENISIGASASYILGVSGIQLSDVKPKDKIDLKVRFNANIGNVINIDEKLDVYPGLSLGLKNFGAHLGTRYFFTDGFGVFAEFGLPLAKYNNNASDFNNQFSTNIGVTFNL